ncbi:Protein SLG1 [Coniosporium tulheliwenetii]|uniref:Protein SLG1 n=1 Tax=Coniosporium tulheliwenetii TaxID=3383036 RepID=A0ACC2ZHV6_9PEZI|nr:Protein SLG1 [Cladosporium sp. JES 115]
MVTSILKSALAAASIISIASGQQLSMPTPTYSGPANALTTVGCFSEAQPLVDQGTHQYQTDGICQRMCLQLSKPVMAMVDGSNCWCGDLKPPRGSEVDMSECNTPCNGYGDLKCGGPSKWAVFLTGITKNEIDYYEPEVSSTAAASTAAPQTSSATVVTVGGSTVIMTVPGSEPTQSGSKSESSGPNTAGIAAGAVVGVVVIAAIVGGVYFFLRQRKRKAVEEEYKRNAAVNDFIGGKPQAPAIPHSTTRALIQKR